MSLKCGREYVAAHQGGRRGSQLAVRPHVEASPEGRSPEAPPTALSTVPAESPPNRRPRC